MLLWYLHTIHYGITCTRKSYQYMTSWPWTCSAKYMYIWFRHPSYDFMLYCYVKKTCVQSWFNTILLYWTFPQDLIIFKYLYWNLSLLTHHHIRQVIIFFCNCRLRMKWELSSIFDADPTKAIVQKVEQFHLWTSTRLCPKYSNRNFSW